MTPPAPLEDVPLAGEEEDWDILQALDLSAEDLRAMSPEQLQALEVRVSQLALEEEERAQHEAPDGTETPPEELEVLAAGDAGSAGSQPAEEPTAASLSADMLSRLQAERDAEEARNKALVMDATIRRLAKEKEDLQAKNAQLEKALLTGELPSGASSLMNSLTSKSSAIATAKARREAKKATLAAVNSAELERQLRESRERVAACQKGVDIVVVMDLTGSMGSWIEACKSKAVDILRVAASKFPGAITRMAFVGYRDYGSEAGAAQHVVHDFVGKDQVAKLIDAIQPLRASGGGNAEDLAGALKIVTQLSWESSTRLMIWFGDAPAHGTKYHGGYARNGPNSYPAGDPTGLVPEELLRKLIALRVDYHFARICHHTDVMVGLFKKVYEEAPPGAALFQEHDYASSANTFLDVVVNSLTSSMRRSVLSSSSSEGCTDVELPEAFMVI